MDRFKLFRTFKERGEWVELRFMVEAMRRGYKVLKPWGDSSSFDVALYFGSRIVRVQVKCTSFRFSTGYLVSDSGAGGCGQGAQGVPHDLSHAADEDKSLPL